MRSTKEVDDYLKKNEIDKLNREEIIKYLKSENYLNDFMDHLADKNLFVGEVKD